jgi:pilus assembly protein Flp/PilA
MRIIKNLRSIIRQMTTDEAGVTAVEYGLFAALIAAVIATVVGTIGTDLNTMLGSLSSHL